MVFSRPRFDVPSTADLTRRATQQVVDGLLVYFHFARTASALLSTAGDSTADRHPRWDLAGHAVLEALATMVSEMGAGDVEAWLFCEVRMGTHSAVVVNGLEVTTDPNWGDLTWAWFWSAMRITHPEREARLRVWRELL